MLTSILQPTHLLIVLIVALLLLGPKRLPEAGRALGQGLQEFKGSIMASTTTTLRIRWKQSPVPPPKRHAVRSTRG